MLHGKDLYARWSGEMRRKNYFHAGRRVGVAVSGGPDSVLLLHLMRALASDRGFSLAAVHFNHRLRGAESDGDEDFVQNLACELRINYLRNDAEVSRIAQERGRNLEAVARELRYRYFNSLIDEGHLDIIATAHTANDQAETVLMRLLRGSGTRGLAGIYPVLDGRVVRPFLSLTRDEVLREIALRDIAYRIDSSNLDDRLLRNKVRHKLLPLLAKEYSPGMYSLLNQLANRSRDEESYLEGATQDVTQSRLVSENGEVRIEIPYLSEVPPAIAKRVLRQMAEAVGGPAAGLSHVQVESLLEFTEKRQSGKTLVLSNGIAARKEFSWLVLGAACNKVPTESFAYLVSLPGQVTVTELGAIFRFKILNRHETGKAYNNDGRVDGLDLQRLAGEVVLRNWRAGDSFYPVGSRRPRKLKELFRERKIPVGQRNAWPVVVRDGELVWVRGFPPAKEAAADRQASQVLIVEEERSRPGLVGG